MICPKCGEEISDESKYCNKCGKRIINKREKRKKVFIIICLAILLIFLSTYTSSLIVKNNKYNTAIKLANEGQYDSAIKILINLRNFKNSKNKIDTIKECAYTKANTLIIKNDFKDASRILGEIDPYKEASSKILVCDNIIKGIEQIKNGQYDEAGDTFDIYIDNDKTLNEINKNLQLFALALSYANKGVNNNDNITDIIPYISTSMYNINQISDNYQGPFAEQIKEIKSFIKSHGSYSYISYIEFVNSVAENIK